MAPLFVLLIMLALVGSAAVLHDSSREPEPNPAGTPVTLADNFAVYVGAVARFVATHPPGYTATWMGNTVPDAQMVFPTWYVRNPLWSNKVIDGVITVYATVPLGTVDFSSELAVRSDGAYGAGIVATNGEIVSVRHGRTGIFVPAGVPPETPVIQFLSSN